MLLTNAFDPDPRVHQEAVSLVNAGYDVTILGWDRDLKAIPKERIDGIKVERIYVRSTHGRGTSQMLFLLYFWVKAFVKAFSKDFQVVHCHDFDTLPLGFFLSRLKRSKLVYDAHESYVDMLGNIPSWMKSMIFKVENILLRHTDLLITVGEILREHLARRGAKRTCVVGNWKDPAKFQFPELELKKEKKRLNIADNQMVVSFIANLGDERQLPQLIEAVRGMPDMFLIVGGDGPCKGLVVDATRRHPNIHYLGYVKPHKVPFYTALSDVIFYGFDPNNPNARFSAPNKLFEALAAGKAVITGDFGEIGRIVNENKCGIILENYSHESIRDALNLINTKKRKALNENATAAGRTYTWNKAAEKLIQSYRRLI